MKRKIVFSGLIALAIAAPLKSATWVSIGTTGEPGKLRFDIDELWAADRDTLRREGDTRYIWVKVEVLSRGDDESHVVRKNYYKIDCDKRLLRVLSSIEYDREGIVTSSKSVSDLPYSAGEFIVPETMGEAIAQVACA